MKKSLYFVIPLGISMFFTAIEAQEPSVPESKATAVALADGEYLYQLPNKNFLFVSVEGVRTDIMIIYASGNSDRWSLNDGKARITYTRNSENDPIYLIDKDGDGVVDLRAKKDSEGRLVRESASVQFGNVEVNSQSIE